VLSRVRAVGGPPAKATALIWELSEALVVASSNPGSLNQAMMDLGATVCTKTAPKVIV
jgi:A/G-specific adenine glycosylase